MRYVIVGNGVAGITAATDLAERDSGEVVVYTAEAFPYYFRPQLPRFLAGEVAQESLYARPPSWYDERGIQMCLSSRLTRLIPDQRRIVVDGIEVAYDRLLLATGGFSFVPPIAGADLPGVFSLRSLDDALAIREHAVGCTEAVVIGGGLLGLETARGLRALGLSVTALEFFPRLLPRQLDQEGAAVLQAIVNGLGIEAVTGANTQAIEGRASVERVVLQDGREFPAQIVVVAAGVRADAALAADAGLAVERGIVVDEHMATSAPDVYAAGDVAAFNGRNWGIIPQARAQAQVAAANMAGDDAVYAEVIPSTTLKIVGVDLTSCGNAVPQEDDDVREIRRADPERHVYKKVVLQGDTLVGAIVIGDRDLARQLDRLVAGRASLSQDELDGLL